ncbi:ATP-binding cassette domain-containing protein [Nonomuraea sp. NPDC050643]|uniref:ABC transporter ATP-binding protein/permease n=1 Tax=Nonomuraea sp. NPDC050643 TaxID=3155660 RepID=UPI0033F750F0
MGEQMGLIIETDRLSRAFGDHPAVDGLALAIAPGEIFGLLGPNGAGKTTTIRMLSTLLPPSGGTARVCGFDVVRAAGEVRRRIGYVPQQVSPMGHYLLTGREKAEIEAALYHVPRRRLKARVGEVLELVGLTESAGRLVQEYSGGMQKRLELACGLLHEPELLILDEPTLGLDVWSRHHMWDHIRSLCDEGMTVLLATNYMDEADRLCDRLAIIDHGRQVAGGTPAGLKAALLAILVAAGLLTLALTATAMALACAVPSHGTFFAITGFASLPLLFMSNAFVPLSAMLGWMEAVARLNPLTYAIEAMRLLVLQGWSGGVPVSLAALVLASALLLTVGAWQFARQTSHRVT